MQAKSLPRMVVDLDAVDHNIGVMSRWSRDAGAELYPHVKTTMAARIIERQIDAGAGGVTVATVDQVERVVEYGFHDIIVANEIVDANGLERMARLIDEKPDVLLRTFVDSVQGVKAIARQFRRRPLDVLIDVGTPGGRTGVRSADELRTLAEMVASHSEVNLVGVGGYEGVVAGGREPDAIAQVDRHCIFASQGYLAIADLFETDAPIFTMGGSAYPDRVIRYFPSVPANARRILRSGCYVTHDHGLYAGVSGVPGLVAAVVVEAAVISRPEDGMAVVGAGRRDLPSDAGLPVVLGVVDASGRTRTTSGAQISRLFDHHAVLTDARDLTVGDVVTLGISHPCSAFDRWSEFAVTSAGNDDEDVWQTGFGRTLNRPQ